MPVFYNKSIEMSVEIALSVLKLYLVGDATQKEAFEALEYLEDFINDVRREYQL